MTALRLTRSLLLRSLLPCLALPIALLSVGCAGAPDYGEITDPTPAQQQAVYVLGEIATATDQAMAGEANASELFATHALHTQLQALAVLDNQSPVWGNGNVPGGITPGCVWGHPEIGYDYTVCALLGATVNGDVRTSGVGVEYDLRLNSGPDGLNSINLDGELERIDGRVYGTLEHRIHVELPGMQPPEGVDFGDGVGDVNTITTWAIAYDDVNSCIRDGYVEVEVEAKGQYNATRFLFDGCERVTVQNAVDY